jgi:hypothetical protein
LFNAVVVLFGERFLLRKASPKPAVQLARWVTPASSTPGKLVVVSVCASAVSVVIGISELDFLHN